MKLNELPRYDIGFSEDGYEMGLELNGGWVRYSDAKNAIFALQAHVAELKAKIDGMIERPVVEAIYNFLCNELAEPYETGALIQACTMLEEALGMDDAKEGGEG